MTQDPPPLPFEVEPFPGVVAIVAGKEHGTVLVVTVMLFLVRVCEYTDPLNYGRFWDYSNLPSASHAVNRYLAAPQQSEPSGWQRAIDKDERDRVRVRRVDKASHQIYVEGAED